MAGRTRKLPNGTTNERGRVRKREPRTGPKRAMTLVMLDSNCMQLESLATGGRTTPAEIVQDLIEATCRGQRIALPLMPARLVPDVA